MAKKNRIKTENLTRLLAYIVGYRPYEFGIVPDSNGFIPYKELIQAVNEEDGWKHVRQGSINEILLSKDSCLFQEEDRCIRTIERHWELDLATNCNFLPKILYMGIRRKGHSFVMENGLRKISDTLYTLSKDRVMAERIGKRRDQKPVILEIRAELASSEGLRFYMFGDLFLTEEIPMRYITGPPVPKDVKKSKEEKAARKQEASPDFEPGTFILDLERNIDRSKKSKGRKKRGWKEEARKGRRDKY